MSRRKQVFRKGACTQTVDYRDAIEMWVGLSGFRLVTFETGLSVLYEATTSDEKGCARLSVYRKITIHATQPFYIVLALKQVREYTHGVTVLVCSRRFVKFSIKLYFPSASVRNFLAPINIQRNALRSAGTFSCKMSITGRS
jgi:hypothetical protein